MKIAVISDIHSNLLSLKLALNDARKEKVDKFIFLGDYITDGEHTNEILKIIKNISDYFKRNKRRTRLLWIVCKIN